MIRYAEAAELILESDVFMLKVSVSGPDGEEGVYEFWKSHVRLLERTWRQCLASLKDLANTSWLNIIFGGP
jgi:hypothetical protein